ncbi:MAG TPA: ABC-F family ATP-binding cassette domain-containing protein [Streptosporangiaceae bacterium]|nr:ABC-F family ATP-binding cassette domain-containing protein [Streptosporangiaceae bacterium]
MNLISVEKVSKAFGERPLLDSVSLGVSTGDRIGVVGRNGAGKSTLLSLLAGTGRAAQPDSGRIARSAGLRIGYLRQQDDLSGTVRQAVFGPAATADNDHVWAVDARARSVVAELLGGIDLDADAARLSGGERRRTALASLLASDYDVLLLDEPTNHLDLEAIDWLGRHLRDRSSALVVVSHDRWLLDEACDQMWEVEAGQVHAYDGGYSAYVLAQAERERNAEATERRRLNLARKELAWLRRGPQARSTKPKFRVQAANALIANEPPVRDTVELTSLATARLGKTVLEVENVSLWAGPRELLDHVTWQLAPGERAGLVGVNGSGKTSFLRLLDGSLTPGGAGTEAAGDGIRAEGRVVRGRTVRIAYLSQELAELDPDRRVLESVQEVRSFIQLGKREQSASQMLDRFGFTGDKQWTPIGELSGGERRRLQLLRLLMNEPNVLLLDEPTNDLDIETLTELEDLLDGWPGSMTVVSHDRYFLERVTDHVVALLGDEKLSFLPGGVEQYLDRVRGTREASLPATGGAVAGAGSPGSSGLDAAQERVARKELQRLERQIERLSQRGAALGVEMAENASDYERLTKLGADLRAVQSEKAELEERWLSVAADLETGG